MTQVISVVQQKGGAGKTSLLISLASLMVEDGARVAVIDTDEHRHLTAWAEKGQTDLDYLYEEDDERLAPVVRHLKKETPPYDVILIDTAGFKSAMAIYAITASSLVLIPCKASESDARDAARTHAHVQNVAGNMEKPIASFVVMNDVNERTIITRATRSAIEQEKVPTLDAMLSSRTGFKEMLSTGRGPEGDAKPVAKGLLRELQERQLITYYSEQGAWAKRSA